MTGHFYFVMNVYWMIISETGKGATKGNSIRKQEGRKMKKKERVKKKMKKSRGGGNKGETMRKLR